jgi:periplasmic protein TonB
VGVLLLFATQARISSIVEISVLEKARENPVIPTLAEPRVQARPVAKARQGVFGLSRKALTASDSDGEELKAGNTVAKAPDEKRLSPEDADALPIPTDEYLVTRMPELSAEIRIPYPEQARAKGIQGAVVMDLLVDASGAVREARLVSGPGEGLTEAALKAVRAFRFRPALVQEKPVAVRIRYAYRFVLEK